MPDDEEGPPVIALPERIDRPLRLGPFPSARDALKFLGYAAIGALLSSTVNLPLGILVGSVGLLASLWRPDGEAWDERIAAAVRWKWRTVRGAPPMTERGVRPLLRQGIVRLGRGEHVAIVRTAGTPVAYLPPAELARRFEQFRDVLRATEGRFALLATVTSIRREPFVPVPVPLGGPEGAARAGYSELVRLLCRRRGGRRVYFAVGGSDSGSDALARLEVQVSTLQEGLTALGLRPVRLKDRNLIDAARRFGWAAEGARS